MAAAGSITTTTSKDGAATKYSCAWTSDAAGAVAENAVALKAGMLVAVVCSPGATTPTNDYDVTLTQASGEGDLLNGAGTDMSSTLSNYLIIGEGTTTEKKWPLWIPSGNYWPTVANAGNAKTGTIDIYVL